METKAFPAFGHVLLRTKLKAGDILNDEMMKDNCFSVDNPAPDATGSMSGSKGSYIWVLINGIHTHTNLATGAVDKHERGWCNLVNPLSVGSFKFDSVTDSEYICFSPKVNEYRIPVVPDLELFDLPSGETRNIPMGTRLYLLDGDLTVDGKIIPPMRQLRFASGAETVKAGKHCLGLVFKGF